MAFLFIGGEDVDFATTKWRTYTATDGVYRTTYARCALYSDNDVSTGEDVNPLRGALAAPSTSFWLGLRLWIGAVQNPTGQSFIAFYAGATKVLSLRLTSSNLVEIVLWSGASATVLATSTAALDRGVLAKLDVNLTYAASGTVNVYLGGTLLVGYTGDTTVGGSTAIDGFAFFRPGISSFGVSEVVAATRDTRTLSLKTHTPNALGTGSTWEGTYADIDEPAANESDVVYSATAEQIFSTKIDDLPSGNFTIRAVKVAGSGSRGEAGPQSVQLGVFNGTTDAYGASKPLDTGWTKVSETFETNPTTGGNWTAAAVNDLEIRLKSKS